MTDLKGLAVKLAVVREAENRLKDVKADINGEFLVSLEEGDVKAATLDDGTKLGKVSKVSGRRTPRVVDERALVEWVKRNHPENLVETIRDWYLAELLESARRHGEAVDVSTGEVVPGIEMREGDPYISFRAEKGAGEVIAARWRELAPGALEIEGDAE